MALADILTDPELLGYNSEIESNTNTITKLNAMDILGMVVTFTSNGSTQSFTIINDDPMEDEITNIISTAITDIITELTTRTTTAEAAADTRIAELLA